MTNQNNGADWRALAEWPHRSSRRFSEMTEVRRCPPPWSVEKNGACFIVRDANRQALAYVYFSNRPFGVKRFQTMIGARCALR